MMRKIWRGEVEPLLTSLLRGKRQSALKKEPITKEQYKALLERLLGEKEELSPSAIETIMQYSPPVEKDYASLLYKDPTKGYSIPVFKPLEEARRLAFERPEEYTPYRVRSPIDRLYKTPEGEWEYERMKLGQVFPPGVEKAAKAMAGGEQTYLSPMLVLASEGDWVWRNVIGGRKGIAGKIWKNIYEASKTRKQFTDEKDYFVSTYIKFKTTPSAVTGKESNFMKTFVEPERTKWEAELLQSVSKPELPSTLTEEYLK